MSNDEVKFTGNVKIGMKQSAKLLEVGKAKEVFIAKDAEPHVTSKIIQLSKKAGISIQYVDSMKSLGKSCGIEVGASVVAVVKE